MIDEIIELINDKIVEAENEEDIEMLQSIVKSKNQKVVDSYLNGYIEGLKMAIDCINDIGGTNYGV